MRSTLTYLPKYLFTGSCLILVLLTFTAPKTNTAARVMAWLELHGRSEYHTYFISALDRSCDGHKAEKLFSKKLDEGHFILAKITSKEMEAAYREKYELSLSVGPSRRQR